MTESNEIKRMNVSCINKVRYETKELAEDAFEFFIFASADKRGKNIYRKKIKQYPYRCDYCQGWHLATKK